ncbi:hypothetical protein WN944_018842 [Citrus x changshan-huyou]|uniref:Uncharacterized protein n=1 Tax=Citrus x changshan-huyou TaxID=2935761 RepID=A0AAP0LU45_9ROSI
MVEEPLLSPWPNAESECPRTPLSNAIALNTLPLCPPTLKRFMFEFLPSTAKTVSSSSSDNPHAKILGSNVKRFFSGLILILTFWIICGLKDSSQCDLNSVIETSL